MVRAAQTNLNAITGLRQTEFHREVVSFICLFVESGDHIQRMRPLLRFISPAVNSSAVPPALVPRNSPPRHILLGNENETSCGRIRCLVPAFDGWG